MKVRNGFVSNSSSSSFCLYGAELSDGDIVTLANKFGIDTLDDDGDEIDAEELMDEVNTHLENEGYKSRIVNDGPEYAYFLARYYYDLGDDETGKQFESSVNDVLEKHLPGREAGYHEEVWTDG